MLQKHLNTEIKDYNGVPIKEQSNRIICDDGFTMSVQASEFYYCKPRENKGPYYQVEIGFPNQGEALIAQYAEDIDNLTYTVYGYVPIEIVAQVIQKHSFKTALTGMQIEK